jgi:hypothetical protein
LKFTQVPPGTAQGVSGVVEAVREAHTFGGVGGTGRAERNGSGPPCPSIHPAFGATGALPCANGSASEVGRQGVQPAFQRLRTSGYQHGYLRWHASELMGEADKAPRPAAKGRHRTGSANA